MAIEIVDKSSKNQQPQRGWEVNHGLHDASKALETVGWRRIVEDGFQVRACPNSIRLLERRLAECTLEILAIGSFAFGAGSWNGVVVVE